jgi:LmbE family N-acetylglucosaminyl deacetylase
VNLTITRKQFLTAAGAVTLLSTLKGAPAPPSGSPKILLVVAHPDDEYAFAATIYRVARELGGTVDQIVITDGGGGYRYSTLAEKIYGVALAPQDKGTPNLVRIRREETLAAGRILGIGNHLFLEQKDAGFTLDPDEGMKKLWDCSKVVAFISALLRAENYQFVFTLLPTTETHGHHQAATVLTLQAVEQLPVENRPAVLAADPATASQPSLAFIGNPRFPITTVWDGAPVFEFDRRASFGYDKALNYQIVVNWMIAEHKSQGLFQTDSNKHDVERYWLFRASGSGALEKTRSLFAALQPANSGKAAAATAH